MRNRMLQVCGTTAALGLLALVVLLLPTGTSRAQNGNSISVTNTSAKPLFVEDVDNPARQPFAVRLCNVDLNVSLCGNLPHFITIPSTGRTAIEQVSGECVSDSADSVVASLEATVTGIGVFRTVLPAAPNAAVGFVIPATLTRIYPDPGTDLDFTFSGHNASTGTNGTVCNAWVVGYTIRP